MSSLNDLFNRVQTLEEAKVSPVFQQAPVFKDVQTLQEAKVSPIFQQAPVFKDVPKRMMADGIGQSVGHAMIFITQVLSRLDIITPEVAEMTVKGQHRERMEKLMTILRSKEKEINAKSGEIVEYINQNLDNYTAGAVQTLQEAKVSPVGKQAPVFKDVPKRMKAAGMAASSRDAMIFITQVLSRLDIITPDVYEMTVKGQHRERMEKLMTILRSKEEEINAKTDEIVEYINQNLDNYTAGAGTDRNRTEKYKETAKAMSQEVQNIKAGKEADDALRDIVVRVAKGLDDAVTDADIDALDFDEADIHINIADQELKKEVAEKIVAQLNANGYEAGVSGVGVNIQAPIGTFGSSADVDAMETAQDQLKGLVMSVEPSIRENDIVVKITTQEGTVSHEDAEDGEHAEESPWPAADHDAPEGGIGSRSMDETITDYEEYKKLVQEYENLRIKREKATDKNDWDTVDRLGYILADLDKKIEEYEDDQFDGMPPEDNEGVSVEEYYPEEKDPNQPLEVGEDPEFKAAFNAAEDIHGGNPGSGYEEYKEMIEKKLGRPCTEDECEYIKIAIDHVADGMLGTYDLRGIEDEEAGTVSITELGLNKAMIRSMIEDGDGSYDGTVGSLKQHVADKLSERPDIGLRGRLQHMLKQLDGQNDAAVLSENVITESKYTTADNLLDIYATVKPITEVVVEGTTINENGQTTHTHQYLVEKAEAAIEEAYTNQYLTEQKASDSLLVTKKEKGESFKERYQPKTSYQLEELRRYGL